MQTPWKFLIIGAGRGGTSLLAGLLDGHPGLEVGFEKFSASHLAGKGFDEAVLSRERAETVLAERLQRFRLACEEYAARYPGMLWGNKITTEHLLGWVEAPRGGAAWESWEQNAGVAAALGDFFGRAMADLRIIFLLRDGRACVRSKVQRTGQDAALACAKWRFCVRVYQSLREQEQARPLGVHFVRFEDLVTHPEATLDQVCNYLGTLYTPRMLGGTHSRKMLPEYRQGIIDPSKAATPEQPDPWLSLIANDLRACGYLP